MESRLRIRNGRRRVGGRFALALSVGALLLAVVGSSPVSAGGTASTDIEKVFGQFTRLDRLLTRAIDRAEKGEDIRGLVHQIQDGKLAIVDGAFSAPVYGVPGSTWFRKLDVVDQELTLADAVDTHALRPGLLGSRAHAITVFLDHAKKAKQGLEAELHRSNPTATAMGSLTNGTGGALAYSIETNTSANAFELTLPQGLSVTPTSTPTGFNCTSSGNVEECKNGTVQPNTAVTGTFSHTGTIMAACGCVQVAFSDDDGVSWFTGATLTGPPTDSPPTETLTLSCPATAGTLIQVSGALTPPVGGAVITITYTPPSGSSFTHMVTIGSDGSYSDSAVVSQSGSWTTHASASESGDLLATSRSCSTSVG